MEKNLEIINVCIYNNHLAVHLKHCKSSILQYNIYIKKKIYVFEREKVKPFVDLKMLAYLQQWKQWLTLLFGASKSLQMVTAAMKLKDTYSLEEKL